MKHDFFKFPTTPHLTALDKISIRNDKVMSQSERDEFLRHTLVVEEKVDGANLGISFDHNGNIRAQSRGTYLHLPGSGQWKKLWEWMTPKANILFENLTNRYILFGEWCYAKHSIFYDRLPDWFLGFDIYDKESNYFFSTDRRDKLLRKMHIAQVPVITRGNFKLDDLKKFLTQSKIGNHSAEGIYLRYEQNGWLLKRAKFVRPEFIQSIGEHWSRSAIKVNQLALDSYVHTNI